MKKHSLVALALCAGLPLMADGPNVQVYGILDTGIAHVDHALNFSDDFVVGTNPFLAKGVRTGATGMFNGGLSGTRFGLKASTDLVDGWKAIATLESGINIPTGRISNATESLAEAGGKSTAAGSAVSGQLFARGAFVGLSHKDFGTLSFGRQQNLMYDIMVPYDATGLAQLFAPVGFSGSFLGGGVTENSRVDNSVKYRVTLADAITLSVLTKISGTKGPDNTAATGCNEFTLEYATGPFGAYVGYQTLHNGIAYATATNGSIVTVVTNIGNPTSTPVVPPTTATIASQGTIKGTVVSTTNINAGVKYKFGTLLVSLGYQQIKFEDPSAGDAAYFASISNGSQYAYGQQIASYTTNSIGPNDKKQTLMDLTAAWDVTPKFKLMGGYYNVKTNDYSVNAPTSAKGAQTQNYLSLIGDYAITKAFDVYVGLMSVKGSGDSINAANGWIAADGYDTTKNSVYGFGIRYKF